LILFGFLDNLDGPQNVLRKSKGRSRRLRRFSFSLYFYSSVFGEMTGQEEVFDLLGMARAWT
jgi:hypothetical protein